MNQPENSSATAIAGEVRAWLARRGITGHQAAIELGWTQPYMSRRLSGRVVFNVTDLVSIANLLEVPVTEFFQFPAYEVRRPGSCPPEMDLEAAA